MDQEWVLPSQSTSQRLRRDGMVVFTHHRRTRIFILTAVLGYVLLFVLLIRRIKQEWHTIQDQPLMLKQMTPDQSLILTYALLGLALVLAFLILLYLVRAVVDIWGLQVRCTADALVVENTLVRDHGASWFGTGSLPWQSIERCVGRSLYTVVKGKHRAIRFSPVHQVDRLIQTIMLRAPQAEWEIEQGNRSDS